jgi:hypothetical protein
VTEASFEERLALIHAAYAEGDRAVLDRALAGADDRLAEAAADALGGLGGAGARARLERLLEDESVRRRAGAVRGLRRLADPAAIPALVPVLDDTRPYEPWGTSPERGGIPLRDRVADVIDELAGEPLGGDPERIRAWLAARAG